MITLPLIYSPPAASSGYQPREALSGAQWSEIEPFYPGDPIRQIERASIRAFLEQNRQYLKGRVLDFGAGQQQYRDLVDGEYVPYNLGEPEPVGLFDAVMCNQVLQYCEWPLVTLGAKIRARLKPGGHLLMTYPTSWPEVEPSDLRRWTKAGMAGDLREVGFSIVVHELRAEIRLRKFHIALGYGVVATNARTAPLEPARAKNSTLSAEDSASFLAGKLRREEPFSFFRFGDGLLECLSGKKGGTCDGEAYTPELGRELRDMLDSLLEPITWAPVYLGDWMSAGFDGATEWTRYGQQYAELVGSTKPNWLHFEALLLMRESEALIDFYRAVRADPRRKLFMGPAGNSQAAELLGADCLVTPMANLDVEGLTKELLISDFEVLLFGAGMAGNIPVVKCWEQHPERTYISLGSALDPLGRGKTRKYQMTPRQAQVMFRKVCSGQPSSAEQLRDRAPA
jgi:SAM-dependent methyltransferase